MITGKNWAGELMVMVRESTNQAVVRGDRAVSSRGEQYVILGGRPPHKPSSTGRVYCKRPNRDLPQEEYFPNALGVRWVSPNGVV